MLKDRDVRYKSVTRERGVKTAEQVRHVFSGRSLSIVFKIVSFHQSQVAESCGCLFLDTVTGNYLMEKSEI